jgi:hypothetical protein
MASDFHQYIHVDINSTCFRIEVNFDIEHIREFKLRVIRQTAGKEKFYGIRQ